MVVLPDGDELLVVLLRQRDLLKVRLDALCRGPPFSPDAFRGRSSRDVPFCTDLGMTEYPRYTPYATSTCAGVASSFFAISMTSG